MHKADPQPSYGFQADIPAPANSCPQPKNLQSAWFLFESTDKSRIELAGSVNLSLPLPFLISRFLLHAHPFHGPYFSFLLVLSRAHAHKHIYTHTHTHCSVCFQFPDGAPSGTFLEFHEAETSNRLLQAWSRTWPRHEHTIIAEPEGSNRVNLRTPCLAADQLEQEFKSHTF